MAISSDDPHGDFTVNVSGMGNGAPVLDAIGDKTANAFVNLSFTTTASDNNDEIDDALSFSVSPALPPGATYDTGSGVFSWTPSPADAGSYVLTFSVSDGHASASETITLTVNADNNPPVAVSGGPYRWRVGPSDPVQRDGVVGSGREQPVVRVGLRRRWDGLGRDADARLHVRGDVHRVVDGERRWGAFVERLGPDDGERGDDDRRAGDDEAVRRRVPDRRRRPSVDGVGAEQHAGDEREREHGSAVDDVSWRRDGERLLADSRTAQIGDIDNDGILEMTVSFTRSELQSLLGNVPNGTTVELVLQAQTTSGVPIRGTIMVKIKSGGGNNVSSFASPNPFNPETAVICTLKNAGRVTVRIYSLEGRLVRTLVDGTSSAGSHEVRWNGTDNQGRSVPSGMYFVKTESGADRSVVKLSLLK